jgi:uncharacterized RDD family membrane protein YckC
MTSGLAVVGACDVCGSSTPYDWRVCGACGAQRLRFRDGSHAGYRPLASATARLAAVAFDVTLFALPALATRLLPDQVANPNPQAGDEALIVLLVTAALIYPVVALGAQGRTLGKRLLGLHVVARDGAPLTYPRAAMREGVAKLIELAAFTTGVVLIAAGPSTVAAWVAVSFAFALPAISVGLVFAGAGRATVHDRVAGTVAVRGAPAASAPIMHVAPDDQRCRAGGLAAASDAGSSSPNSEGSPAGGF